MSYPIPIVPVISISIKDFEGFLNSFKNMTESIRSGVIAGLEEGANQILIEVPLMVDALLNKHPTGQMRSSFDIINRKYDANEISIAIGSSILGYPYYQERGFMAKGFLANPVWVPGKWPLQITAMSVGQRIPEMMKNHISRKMGGKQ